MYNFFKEFNEIYKFTINSPDNKKLVNQQSIINKVLWHFKTDLVLSKQIYP